MRPGKPYIALGISMDSMTKFEHLAKHLGHQIVYWAEVAEFVITRGGLEGALIYHKQHPNTGLDTAQLDALLADFPTVQSFLFYCELPSEEIEFDEVFF